VCSLFWPYQLGLSSQQFLLDVGFCLGRGLQFISFETLWGLYFFSTFRHLFRFLVSGWLHRSFQCPPRVCCCPQVAYSVCYTVSTCDSWGHPVPRCVWYPGLFVTSSWIEVDNTKTFGSKWSFFTCSCFLVLGNNFTHSFVKDLSMWLLFCYFSHSTCFNRTQGGSYITVTTVVTIPKFHAF
jgi:hypothetical protein